MIFASKAGMTVTQGSDRRPTDDGAHVKPWTSARLIVLSSGLGRRRWSCMSRASGRRARARRRSHQCRDAAAANGSKSSNGSPASEPSDWVGGFLGADTDEWAWTTGHWSRGRTRSGVRSRRYWKQKPAWLGVGRRHWSELAEVSVFGPIDVSPCSLLQGRADRALVCARRNT